MTLWDQIQPFAVVFAAVIVPTVLVARIWSGRRRLFTYPQKALIQRVAGPGCVWRPVHFPQGIGAAWVILNARSNPQSPLWMIAAALAVLAGTGLPITRTRGSCRGPIQGGHQWAASHGGTTSIWNCEATCEAHNNDQSDRWSWRYAAGQWGPWTVTVYGVRYVRQLVLLTWCLAHDPEARRQASA